MPARAPLRPLPPVGGWRARFADLADRVGLSSRPWVAGLTVVAVIVVVVSGVMVNRASTPKGVAGLPKATPGGGPVAVQGVPPGAVAGPAVNSGAATTTSTAPDVVVHVVGAVHHPGVHRLPGGSRVADAITAAGGVTADADASLVNAARPLADGEQIRVPRKGEPPPPTAAPAPGGRAGTAAGGTNTQKPQQPIDINTASEADLEALPGIGPATAAAIVKHRTTKGRFTTVDQLEEVPGIGPARLEQLRPHVRV